MPYADREDKRSWERAKIQRLRNEWLTANGPCRKCGSTTNLEVDHVDPSQKESHKIWTWSPRRRSEELAKCQVLCKVCHLAKTGSDQEPPHGTNGRYTAVKWRCRCDLCKEAHRQVNAEYR